LEEVDLTKSADLPADSYSGGMKRRLSVAMAAIGDPKVKRERPSNAPSCWIGKSPLVYIG
jgi:ABC-type phosphonate transport system ATPase subunit